MVYMNLYELSADFNTMVYTLILIPGADNSEAPADLLYWYLATWH